jgi:hypothetical protein
MIYTLLFYAYALLGAPWFRGSLRRAFETEQVCMWPGLILIFALLAETIALPLKFRVWHSDGGKECGLPLKLGSAICITHVILTYFLGIYILDAFGVMGGVKIEGGASRWMAMTFILLFFREGYLFFASSRASRSKKPIPKSAKIGCDILLLFFQCVAYTAYWDVMIAIAPVKGLHWASWFGLGPALILLFYIVYLPIRMTDLLGSYYLDGPAAGRGTTIRLLISGAVLGFYPVVGPPLIALIAGH